MNDNTRCKACGRLKVQTIYESGAKENKKAMLDRDSCVDDDCKEEMKFIRLEVAKTGINVRSYFKKPDGLELFTRGIR